jgi:hypothetical protein
VLITLVRARGLPALDRGAVAAALDGALDVALERGGRRGLELLGCSFHRDHLHLIVRVRDRGALSRAMNGLGVRLARAVNRAIKRRGTVFADRYEARALSGPRELRAAKRAPCAWRTAPDAAGKHRTTSCRGEASVATRPER